MTMHLERAYITTTRVRSRQKKSKKNQSSQAAHQEWLKQRGLSLTQLKEKLPHTKKGRRVGVYELPDLKVEKTVSTSDSIGNGFKKKENRYTSDEIVGIGTMHKSNSVPVLKGSSAAKDLASMRR
jgi:hypothetical protein